MKPRASLLFANLIFLSIFVIVGSYGKQLELDELLKAEDIEALKNLDPEKLAEKIQSMNSVLSSKAASKETSMEIIKKSMDSPRTHPARAEIDPEKKYRQNLPDSNKDGLRGTDEIKGHTTKTELNNSDAFDFVMNINEKLDMLSDKFNEFFQYEMRSRKPEPINYSDITTLYHNFADDLKKFEKKLENELDKKSQVLLDQVLNSKKVSRRTLQMKEGVLAPYKAVIHPEVKHQIGLRSREESSSSPLNHELYRKMNTDYIHNAMEGLHKEHMNILEEDNENQKYLKLIKLMKEALDKKEL